MPPPELRCDRPDQVSILISPYSDSNQRFRIIKERADQLMAENRVQEARTECETIFHEGRIAIKELFRDFWPPLLLHPVFGMFDQTVEPSFILNLRAPREKHPLAQSKMIEFGERFGQQNVHMLQLIERHSEQVKLSQVVHDRSAQVLYTAVLNELQTPLQIGAIAREAGLEGFTISREGHQVFMYTTSIDPARAIAQERQITQFQELLKEKGLAFVEKDCHLWLSNFGEKAFDASHTYEEARSMISQPSAIRT